MLGKGVTMLGKGVTMLGKGVTMLGKGEWLPSCVEMRYPTR